MLVLPNFTATKSYAEFGNVHRTADTSILDRTLLTEPKSAEVAATVEIPGFTVRHRLGHGASGVIYLARQESLKRDVALKILRAECSGEISYARFRTEAESIAAISHPNVVKIFACGNESGQLFLALEYLPGGTLTDRLRDRSGMNSARAARLLLDLARGTAAAHELGIVHRDIKPSNVLFDETETPKITDFGLAKRIDTDLTAHGSVLGTPAYMSPEQARGEMKTVGPASDVWSLGVILYECLTGTRPFAAEQLESLLSQIRTVNPASPRAIRSEVPRDLERICMKCLMKDAADRYASARELAEDLERYLNGQPVRARTVGPLERGYKWAKRRPAITGLIASLMLIVTAGFAAVGYFAMEQRRTANELRTALAERDLAMDTAKLAAEKEKLIARRFLQFLKENPVLLKESEKIILGEFLRQAPDLDRREVQLAFAKQADRGGIPLTFVDKFAGD